MSSDSKATPLCAALAAKPRWFHECRLDDFLSHDGSELPAVRVQVLTKREECDAIAAAYDAMTRHAKKARAGADRALNDGDYITDRKTIEALYRAFRQPDNDGEYPAFISPEWMEENLETDQISVLLSIYSECRKRRPPVAFESDDHYIDAIRRRCWMVRNEVVPEMALVQYDREELSTLLCEMSWAYTRAIESQQADNESPAKDDSDEE